MVVWGFDSVVHVPRAGVGSIAKVGQGRSRGRTARYLILRGRRWRSGGRVQERVLVGSQHRSSRRRVEPMMVNLNRFVSQKEPETLKLKAQLLDTITRNETRVVAEINSPGRA